MRLLHFFRGKRIAKRKKIRNVKVARKKKRNIVGNVLIVSGIDHRVVDFVVANASQALIVKR